MYKFSIDQKPDLSEEKFFDAYLDFDSDSQFRIQNNSFGFQNDEEEFINIHNNKHDLLEVRRVGKEDYIKEESEGLKTDYSEVTDFGVTHDLSTVVISNFSQSSLIAHLFPPEKDSNHRSYEIKETNQIKLVYPFIQIIKG